MYNNVTSKIKNNPGKAFFSVFCILIIITVIVYYSLQNNEEEDDNDYINIINTIYVDTFSLKNLSSKIVLVDDYTVWKLTKKGEIHETTKVETFVEPIQFHDRLNDNLILVSTSSGNNVIDLDTRKNKLLYGSYNLSVYHCAYTLDGSIYNIDKNGRLYMTISLPISNDTITFQIDQMNSLGKIFRGITPLQNKILVNDSDGQLYEFHYKKKNYLSSFSYKLIESDYKCDRFFYFDDQYRKVPNIVIFYDNDKGLVVASQKTSNIDFRLLTCAKYKITQALPVVNNDDVVVYVFVLLKSTKGIFRLDSSANKSEDCSVDVLKGTTNHKVEKFWIKNDGLLYFVTSNSDFYYIDLKSLSTPILISNTPDNLLI